MPEIRVAKRYAAALFELAKREETMDRVQQDLGEVEALVAALPKLSETLDSPVIPAEPKKKFLREALAGKISDLTLNFLELLVDKHRTEVLEVIPGEFRDLADESRNVAEADVKSAVALAADQEAALIARLSELTGKSIRLSATVDPSLIGGLTVRIGDTVMDGSVFGQLKQIQERLAAG